MASAARIASGRRSHRRVLPSMSVKRKVTRPVGKLAFMTIKEGPHAKIAKDAKNAKKKSGRLFLARFAPLAIFA